MFPSARAVGRTPCFFAHDPAESGDVPEIRQQVSCTLNQGDGHMKKEENEIRKGTFTLKSGLAQMLKGGVIMDVTTPEQARIAQEAGACAVMALERVPEISASPELWPAWRIRIS